jgi:hypothetical protein
MSYDPERRVPKFSNDESTPLWRDYTLNDAALVLGPGFLAMLTLMFLPDQFMLSGLIWSLLLGVVGVIVVLTTPEYMTATEWLTHHISHRIRPSEYHHIKLHAEHKHREQKEEPEHNFVTSALSATQRTQDILGVDRIFPSDEYGPGAIQLRDGTLIGAVRVLPANLTLATAGEWRNATSSLATFVNTIDFRVLLYHTNRQFDVDKFLSPYRQRRTDPDVRSEPALEELLESFLSWYPERLERDGTTISEYYIVVGVEEHEVRSDARTSGIADQLAEMPVFSYFVGPDEDDEEIPEAVIRGRQRKQLYDRIEQVINGVQQIPDTDSELVNAEDHAATIARAWQREEMNIDPAEHFGRNPVVHHSEERAVDETPTSDGVAPQSASDSQVVDQQ